MFPPPWQLRPGSSCQTPTSSCTTPFGLLLLLFFFLEKLSLCLPSSTRPRIAGPSRIVGGVSLPALGETSRAARPLEEGARPADAGALLEWEMSAEERRGRAEPQTRTHTTVGAGGETSAHGRITRARPRVYFSWQSPGDFHVNPRDSPDSRQRCAHSSTGLSPFFARRANGARSPWERCPHPSRPGDTDSGSPPTTEARIQPEVAAASHPQTNMEQQLSKPEPRSMDACLRRLKQELVRPVCLLQTPLWV